MRQPTELDKILTGDKNKVISKMYKCLLKIFTEDETVKTQMVRWAEILNRTIMMDE